MPASSGSNGLTSAGSQYSPVLGFFVIFNLIVGTGALALPKAFQQAGWLLGVILLVVIAFFAFVTATYVIEAMAIGNALIWLRKKRDDLSPEIKVDEDADGDAAAVSAEDDAESDVAASNPFDIQLRIELGRLATMLFNKIGQTLFYLAMAIYLYGDLAIYATAVPNTLLDVSCTYLGNVSLTTNCTNGVNASKLSLEDPCWQGVSLTRFDVYRLYVTAFVLLLGPFAFFNVQKTMMIQVVTTLLRWASLSAMTILAIIMLASPTGGHGHPSAFDINGLPMLFGSAIYGFMCHHSLPSLITPIRSKSRLTALIIGDFSTVLLFYALMAVTGVFAFNQIEDLYSLNFRPTYCDTGSNHSPATTFVPLQYFISLFPVFTISASFPIIAITLRNNIHALVLSAMSFLRKRHHDSPRQSDESLPIVPKATRGSKLSFAVERIALPLIALLPPVAIALATNDVGFLVGITGSYAGAFVQYLIPAALVFCARRKLASVVSRLSSPPADHVHSTSNSDAAIRYSPRFPLLDSTMNPHRSFFAHTFWVVLVCIWAVVSITLVTVNHITSGK